MYLCTTDASLLSLSAAPLSNLASNYEQMGVQPLVFWFEFFFPEDCIILKTFFFFK